MTDRKEVMTWLKICGMGDFSECCPYKNGEVRASACYEQLMMDALSLLKEQEKEIPTINDRLSNPIIIEHPFGDDEIIWR